MLEGLFASDLGWPPGSWPASFVHEGVVLYRGRALNDCDGYEYANVAHGVAVRVFND